MKGNKMKILILLTVLLAGCNESTPTVSSTTSVALRESCNVEVTPKQWGQCLGGCRNFRSIRTVHIGPYYSVCECKDGTEFIIKASVKPGALLK